jgi:hypothetical protein
MQKPGPPFHQDQEINDKCIVEKEESVMKEIDDTQEKKACPYSLLPDAEKVCAYLEPDYSGKKKKHT